ncbi:MAG: transporter substrate-binding domain-containing protein [Rickettsiales bacterium]|nr:transporter substrate-binding domain-containing protein [Rickettsiales bacterium]
MKKKYLIPLLFLCFGYSTAQAEPTETITLVADYWCPYNCEEKAAAPGYMVEVAKQIYNKANINVVYKVMTWKDAIAEARKGTYTAIVGANRGDAPDFIFPELVQGISINQVWIRNDSDFKYKNMRSLDNLRLGVVEGYSYGKIADSYIAERIKKNDGTIVVLSGENVLAANINALLKRHVDAILEDRNVIEYYFASHNLPMTIKSAGNPVDINDYSDTYVFIAFSPNHPKSKEYAKLLSNGMRQMRQNGELEKILDIYNMDHIYRFIGKTGEIKPEIH